jgi:hypothetical protein
MSPISYWWPPAFAIGCPSVSRSVLLDLVNFRTRLDQQYYMDENEGIWTKFKNASAVKGLVLDHKVEVQSNLVIKNVLIRNK